MSKFCVEGSVTNPKCVTLENFDFTSEEQIFDIILDILKSELPPRMALVMDCQNQPMFIAEENIDLIPAGQDARFEVLLNPVSEIPEYTESRESRIVEYTLELILTVHNELAKCITWEMIRFKNAVEGLIIAAELAIDGYESVYIEPKGFSHFVPESDGVVYRKQGSYRFTVTVTQYKNN